MATSGAATSRCIHLLPYSPTTTALAIASPPAASSHILLLHNKPAATSSSLATLRSTGLFLPHRTPLSSPLSLRIQSPKPYLVKINATSDFGFPIPLPNNLLSDSTRTISSIFASALVFSKVILEAVESISLKIFSAAPKPTPEQLSQIRALKDSMLCSVHQLFFTAMSSNNGRGRARRQALNTPMSVMAGAVVKWVDFYTVILVVRILLNWIPNVPWDKQPFSIIRDLSDPYFNLFRGVIPPVFNVDISVQYAFLVLEIIRAILASMG